MAMTTLPYENTAEGGTDGVVVTTANSGGTSGTAWSLVNTGGTPDPTYDNAQAMHGSMSILFGGGNTREVRWYSLASYTVYAVAHFRFSSVAPSNNHQIIQARTSSDAGCATIGLSTSGRIIAWNRNGVTISGTDIAGHTISADTWYRIEVIFTNDSGNAATGRVQYAIYEGDSATPITTEFDSGASVAMQTVLIDRLYLGGAGGLTVSEYWMDSIGAEGGRSIFYGPWVINTSPWYVQNGSGLVSVNVYVSDGV